jgi:hypothetical protein
MSKIFDRAVQTLEHNMNVRLNGGYNCIPFPESLSRFRNYIPGLQRKNYVIITANSGVAKSKFAKFFYVLSPHHFVMSHPELEMKLDTLYFCLEENKENFIDSLICNRLFTQYGIRIDIKHLKSIHLERYLNQETLEKVKEQRDYFYQLEDNLQVIDDVRNPTGIYKTAQEFIERQGRWIMKEIEIDETDNEGNPILEANGSPRRVKKEVRDYFKYTNDKHYVQVVVDHKSLISKEKGQATQWEAIQTFSSTYAIRLRDKYEAALTSVQQQEAAKEKQQYTVKGVSIEEKLEPTLDGLGDNKTTQRDADEIIGIFSPHRHQIPNHRGYNIRLLRDNYRSAIILKCRDGSPDLRVGLYFDGAVNTFAELPKADLMQDPEYDEILSRVGRVRPQQRVLNFG